MQKALPAAAVELVENVGLLGLIDSLPLVGDAYQQTVRFELGTDAHRRPGGRVARGIFQQMTQHATDQFPVQGDRGHVGRQLYRHGAPTQQYAAILERHVNHLLQALRSRPHLNAVAVELGHFDRLADQAVEACTFLIENGEHLVPLALGERRLRQQAGCRRPYRCQRGA